MPLTSFPLRRPPRPLVLALLLGAALAAAAADPFVSPSPRPRAAPVRPAPLEQAPAPWAGRVWAGPDSGAPAMPSARQCARSPARFEIDEAGRERPLGRWDEPGQVAGGDRGDRRERRAMAAEAALGVAPTMSTPLRGDSPPAPVSPKALTDARVGAAARPGAGEAAGDRVLAERAPAGALLPGREPMEEMIRRERVPRPLPRPAEESVSAGMVDDNADFGAWTDFLARHEGIGGRPLDVSARMLVEVRDEAGRPVPDAALSLWDGATALPLWARTDAGGRAWLFPSASRRAPRGEFLEVRAQAGGRESAAVWRRGQRDAVQLRLTGVEVPARARLDLAFLIDATGSMDDEIAKLRRHMHRIAGQIAALPSRPDLCFALVAYRDRGDAFFVRVQDFSADLGAIQSALDGLRAQGGGDYPEAFDEALHVAVHRLSWRGDGTARLLVPVADAPPQLDRGGPWYDDDALGAAARGIKLLPVGASGLDRLGEMVMRQLAQFTGGRFVFLTYADPERPQAGPGRHTLHEVGPYTVESLDALIVRLVSEELARWPRG